MTAATAPVVVIGELLVDIVHTPDGQTAEHVGGSPANVALGLARLGHDTWFATLVGTDDRGIRCTEHVEAGGRAAAARQHEPGAPDVDGRGDHRRVRRGVLRLRPALEPPARSSCPRAPPTCTSARSAPRCAPGDVEVTAAVHRARAAGTVSYDPNMRPTIMGSADDVRPRVEELVALSDVVKCSEDDIEWLYPGQLAVAGHGPVGGARRRAHRRHPRPARASPGAPASGEEDSEPAHDVDGRRHRRRRRLVHGRAWCPACSTTACSAASPPATGCGPPASRRAPRRRPRPGDERPHGPPRRRLRPHPGGDLMVDGLRTSTSSRPPAGRW